MFTITDHLGRNITLTKPPKRIISLVPAITETMFHLELDNKIVGRTRFCIFPKEKVQNVINIGGTKDIKLDRIHALKPDLIIAEKEENTKEIVETLEKHYPVFVFEIQNIGDVYRMIQDLGSITEKVDEALKLMKEIQTNFNDLPNVSGKRAAYVIWKKPYMVVGKDTYIQSLLEKMGFVNPFMSYQGRYPTVSIKDFELAKLDYILLATEPYPFQEKDLGEFQLMVPKGRPMLIDGEMFWYGARMLQATNYFKEIFNDFNQ